MNGRGALGLRAALAAAHLAAATRQVCPECHFRNPVGGNP